MWAPHQTPEPIEKIRKAQWSAENTRATQHAVDDLDQILKALALLGVHDGPAIDRLKRAMMRFKDLDGKVRLSWE